MIKKKQLRFDALKSVRALQNSNNYEIVNAVIRQFSRGSRDLVLRF